MSDPVVAFIYHKITGRGVFRNLSQGGGAQHLLGPKTPLEISDFTERPPPNQIHLWLQGTFAYILHSSVSCTENTPFSQKQLSGCSFEVFMFKATK